MENGSESGAADRQPNSGERIFPAIVSADGDSPSRGSLIREGWPTVDGPLGLSHDDSLVYARRFFRFGFLCLPFLWAVNCFYFWPVLRNPNSRHSHPLLRRYVLGSAIGFLAFTAVLLSWALTFAVGGEKLFGPVWQQLVVYNMADKYGLTGWI